MNRHYPKTIFASIVSLDEQFDHICSEYREAVLAEGDRRDEELADLEHSIQTYFDIRARQGVDVDGVRAAVVKKNFERGYYRGGLPGGENDRTDQGGNERLEKRSQDAPGR